MKKILSQHARWVLVVREHPSTYEKQCVEQATSSRSIHVLIRERILSEMVEVLYVVCLDNQNRVVHLAEVARGGLSSCAVTARDILTVVLMTGANAFVLVHNHPNGSNRPSNEDIVMTHKVEEASKVIGVQLTDHIIVSGWESYYSFLDSGLI